MSSTGASPGPTWNTWGSVRAVTILVAIESPATVWGSGSLQRREPPLWHFPERATRALDFAPVAVVLVVVAAEAPQPATKRRAQVATAKGDVRMRGARAAEAGPPVESLQAQGQNERREGEDQRDRDGDPVEVLLTTVDPAAACPTEPPNMSDSPPPLPECMRIKKTSARAAARSTTSIAIVSTSGTSVMLAGTARRYQSS